MAAYTLYLRMSGIIALLVLAVFADAPAKLTRDEAQKLKSAARAEAVGPAGRTSAGIDGDHRALSTAAA